MTCPACQAPVEADAKACARCGRRLDATPATDEATPPGLRWRWVWRSALITLLTSLALSLLLIAMAPSPTALQEAMRPEQPRANLLSFFALFIGGLLSAYHASVPLRLEPGVAAALLVISLGLLAGQLLGVLLATIPAFLIATAGAIVGRKLQGSPPPPAEER